MKQLLISIIGGGVATAIGAGIGAGMLESEGAGAVLLATSLIAAITPVALPVAVLGYRCRYWAAGIGLAALAGLTAGCAVIAREASGPAVILTITGLASAGVSSTVFYFGGHLPIPPHCCQSCGYNLTGNVSGTCPECGAPAGPVGA